MTIRALYLKCGDPFLSRASLRRNTHFEVSILCASVLGTRIQVLFLRIEAISDWTAGSQCLESSPLVAALKEREASEEVVSRAVVLHHSLGVLRLRVDRRSPTEFGMLHTESSVLWS